MNTTQYTVSRNEQSTPLKEFIRNKLHISGSKAKKLLDQRCIFVNGNRTWMSHHRLKMNDRVEVIAPPSTSPNQPLPLLYQDAFCCVINKPPTLLANGPDSCESRLQLQLKNDAWRVVHRLDRTTSGCLIAASSPESYDHFVELFRNKAITKHYRALLTGTLQKESGTLRQPLDERTAETRYKLLRATPLASDVLVELVTGRTHQVRRHFAGIGYPLLGDTQYGRKKIENPMLRAIPRQMLHAASITFTPPHSETPITVKAPLPPDYRKTLQLIQTARY